MHRPRFGLAGNTVNREHDVVGGVVALNSGVSLADETPRAGVGVDARAAKVRTARVTDRHIIGKVALAARVAPKGSQAVQGENSRNDDLHEFHIDEHLLSLFLLRSAI